MRKMTKRELMRRRSMVRGLISTVTAIGICGAIFIGATSESSRTNQVVSEINHSINRATSFIAMGDYYSAKLILNEDILNNYDSIPEDILPGVENLSAVINNR